MYPDIISDMYIYIYIHTHIIDICLQTILLYVTHACNLADPGGTHLGEIPKKKQSELLTDTWETHFVAPNGSPFNRKYIGNTYIYIYK